MVLQRCKMTYRRNTSKGSNIVLIQHKERTFLQAKPYKDHPTIAR
ncbi:unnamed protein product [Brassica rapa]|uniref:Uncharacterized protein n=1 Tax=Brassica campestris TaxID=3711 RepID=A0A8D9D8X4_BRACM|nr:unnamed protein product [Brassica rapa]